MQTMKTITAIIVALAFGAGMGAMLTGCTTTVTTTQDAKGAIVVTKNTSPPSGLVQAAGVAVGDALAAALNAIISNQSGQ